MGAYFSETFTASTAAAQTAPMRGLMIELMIEQPTPTPIFVDCKSTILVAQNRAAVKRSSYILRRARFLQEGIEDGEFDFFYCKGKDNHADQLTKPIYNSVQFLRSRIYYMNTISTN